MENKTHWYDGRFYDKFIAPNQDEIFGVIKNLIPGGSSVIDAGCGTGRLPLQLASSGNNITGVDLSLKNISLAMDNARAANVRNVEFIHSSITELDDNLNYDFATMSFVIHEIPIQKRIEILKKLKQIAGKLIIVDYAVGKRPFASKVLNEIVEFAAGFEHYKGYKSFVRQGGLKTLLTEAGYEYKLIEQNIGFSSEIYLSEPVKYNGQ